MPLMDIFTFSVLEKTVSVEVDDVGVVSKKSSEQACSPKINAPRSRGRICFFIIVYRY